MIRGRGDVPWKRMAVLALALWGGSAWASGDSHANSGHGAFESHEAVKTHEADHAHEATPQHKPLMAAAVVTIDLPTGCRQAERYPCALRTEGRGEFRWAGASLQGTPDSELLLLDPKTVQFLKGSWWIRDAHRMNVKFGEVGLGIDGDSLWQRQEREMHVVNLKGRVEIRGPSGESSAVPEGYQSRLAGLDARARIVQTELRAAPAIEVFEPLLGITGPRYGALQERRAEYQKLQRVAVESSAALFREAVEKRRLASAQVEADLAAKKRRAQLENEELRRMYRARYYGDDSLEGP